MAGRHPSWRYPPSCEVVVSAVAGKVVRVPERVRCAICGRAGDVTPFAMNYGVTIHLCQVHRNPNHLRRKWGHVFVTQLTRVWQSHGILTLAQQQALISHICRVRRALSANDLPGSYAWKEQREHAEKRASAGDGHAAIITDIRDTTRWLGRAPTIRTIQRWLADARWLTPPRTTHPTTRTLIDTTKKIHDGYNRVGRVWHTDDDASREQRRQRTIGIHPRK